MLELILKTDIEAINKGTRLGIYLVTLILLAVHTIDGVAIEKRHVTREIVAEHATEIERKGCSGLTQEE